MRVLSIDYGERRIGLALSDPDFDFVSGLPTIDRKTLTIPLTRAIAEIVEERGVDRIVLGIPYQMDGTEGLAARTVREFQSELAAAVDPPIDEWDERLTTEAAQRALRDAGYSEKEMRSKIDQLTAVLMLESYLRRVRADEERTLQDPEQGPHQE
jgi:putative Holliday junction resolvase